MTKEDRIILGTKAVRLGKSFDDLLPIQSHMCAGGCGRVAEHYHHYSGYEDWQLLDVIPVCRYCHFLANQIRNGEEVDLDRPEVGNLLATIESEKEKPHRRRLYLMGEFRRMGSRCRYVVSRVGKNPAVISSDLHLSAFSEYMHYKQVEDITLDIECVLCGCSLSLVFADCKCPCHIQK